MVDDDVLRLDVSVHNALGMRVVEAFEDLVEVVLGVAGSEQPQQCLVVGLLHVLEHETVDLSLLHDVQQLHHVVFAAQRHQDLHLSVYLLELYFIA